MDPHLHEADALPCTELTSILTSTVLLSSQIPNKGRMFAGWAPSTGRKVAQVSKLGVQASALCFVRVCAIAHY